MYGLMTGAIAMASLIAGLFFLRFWKKTRDRLFLFFALAFWLLAVNRVGLAFVDEALEAYTFLYLLRLLAFLLILFAILDKNRAARQPKGND
ncbi:MAG: DUF5985 family protein [Pseudomonadota bacterium]|uniref:DUF5985 family protein n=2 Tax=Thermithiobacillus tepidarius TaxID=929 RepID=UPI00041CE6EB